MKYLFLDTNVLLHFNSYTDVKWNEIIGSPDFTICITPIVIAELDKYKNSPNKKINKKAKTNLNRIEQISDGMATLQFKVDLVINS